MKRSVFIICVGLFLSVSGYANNVHSKGVGTQKEQQLKDNQILNIIRTIDKGEIDASKEALKKTTNPEVKNYANYLIQQHQENLDQAIELEKQLNIKFEDSTISVELNSHSKESLQKLAKLQGHEFDKAYIEAMVNDHEKGLKLIDTQLLHQTKNPKLRTFVEQTRKTVSIHLEKARKILNTL